ncbi:MAG: hypothetical protein Q9184_004544 [Pyrenodesmia sp. 2 TL-2023]
MDEAGSVSVRKSGRKPQPKKFSQDEITNLDIFSSASEGEVESFELLQQLADSSNDDEFNSDQAAAEADDPEEEVFSSEGAASDGSDVATPVEDYEDAASYASEDEVRAREDGDIISGRQSKGYDYVYGKHTKPEAGTHIRGVPESASSSKGSRPEFLYSLFGNATKDLVHLARSMDQWGDDLALPRRPNESGRKGIRHHFSHDADKRLFEATEGWDWYYKYGGRQKLAEVQRSHSLTSEEGMLYVPQPSHTQQTVFMGPYGRQSPFVVRTFQSMCLDEAWKATPPVSGVEEHIAEPPRPRKQKIGWLLNVGTGARSLEWAPNHSGDTQYLAISTLQPKDHEKIGQLKFSPAFTPQSFPSSIQIWSFSSSEKPPRETLLDSDNPPRLQLVICTEWGDPRHLTWCPMPRDFRECDYEGGQIPIGLLASVWSDGHVRVLDIHLEQTENTTFVKYTAAAFTAKPPSTLCTSVTWLSPTELAVGCANGYLAIWCIYPPPSSKPQPSLTPQPAPTLTPTSTSTSTSHPKSHSPHLLLYTPLQTTYILSLSTAYPLAPHLLASSSASGHLRLTSLLHPQTDYVLSLRMRHAPTSIRFSEPSHAFLTADDNDSVKAWPIRRFFSPVNVARMPANGICLAAGEFHNSVLVGCADGSVCAVNPMRKMLYPKATAWQLPVFRHEWRRATAEERRRGEGGAGKVRITEGYKLKDANMAQGAKRGTGKAVEGVVVATVWEEEGHVRSVAWGRSVEVGGWVAVGMGSGLVRVEDLAI